LLQTYSICHSYSIKNKNAVKK